MRAAAAALNRKFSTTCAVSGDIRAKPGSTTCSRISLPVSREAAGLMLPVFRRLKCHDRRKQCHVIGLPRRRQSGWVRHRLARRVAGRPWLPPQSVHGQEE